ncbi:hypothetical protein COLO4_04632 [Corchorus olitorius]|uniref:Uncharacterized protein n=1 Tax=Corchorus olitorius TaxID=93759 RepID=A0A1R3KTD7_9ROSI|nr:hypothetical protein COLO4_04632 [Corchorus olitorius]
MFNHSNCSQRVESKEEKKSSSVAEDKNDYNQNYASSSPPSQDALEKVTVATRISEADQWQILTRKSKKRGPEKPSNPKLQACQVGSN